jgi:hypothetical protein
LETLAQFASGHMRPMEQQISVERVAEIMWQRGNDTDPAVKAHLAWLALLEDERRYWCDRAEAAIADWRRATARNRREAWSNLMERWFASRLTNDARHAAGRDDHSPAVEVPAGSHTPRLQADCSGEAGGVGGRAEVEPVSSAGGTLAA